MTDLSAAPLQRLSQWTAISATGGDAKSFLQGQLSFDLDRLTPGRMELASCSSGQGRVQAVIWLVQRSDFILLLVHASVAQALLARLRKYVLRAKVKLEISDRFQVFAAESHVVDAAPQTHLEVGERSYVRWPGERVVCIAPAGSAATSTDASDDWRRADIAAGLPQVYPETNEAFVAQMLNLDLLGGISFEKGCYTGQEIIARTHFRGAVKRRMFRFGFEGAAPVPGTRIVNGEQHAGDVVDAIADDGQGELLAVITLSQANEPLRIGASDGPSLTQLPLPYQL